MTRGAEIGPVTEQATPEEQVSTSVCRPNCFGTCRLNVHVRDGRVVGTSMAHLPDPRYERICLRGLSQVQRIYHPDRLKYPMKRAGERGEGKWERISWDEALATIADEFNRIRRTYGDQAIVFNPVCGSYGGLNGIVGSLVSRMVNVLGATIIDDCLDYSASVGLNRVLGGPLGSLMNANEPADLSNARTIITWGANLTESKIHDWHFIADAMEKGAKLVVVDPRFSATAAKADIFVPLRPGSDAALALSMMHVIIQEGLLDEPFLLSHTVAPFLVREDTRRFLRLSDLEGPTRKEDESDHYMVWDEVMQRPVSTDDASKPALRQSCEWAGIRVHTAFQALVEVTAKYSPAEAQQLTAVEPDTVAEIARLYATSKPASFYVGFGCNSYDNGDVTGHALATLAALTGNVGLPGASPGQFWLITDCFDYDALGSPDGKEGHTIPALVFPDVVRSAEYAGQPFPLKALYVTCGNPVSNVASQRDWFETILPAMDLVVVADMAMTDTAWYADIVLPAAHWFEVTDIIGLAGGLPYLQLAEKVVEPAFEAKSDADIWRALAPRLGVGHYFTHTDWEFIELLLDNDTARSLGITPAVLQEKKVLRSLRDPYVMFSDMKFDTPSGRMEFFAEQPVTRFDFGQDLSARHSCLPEFRPPAEAWPENPLYAKYPLVCMQEHTRWRVHTQWFDTPWLRELDPEPIVFISPADAIARSIQTGDRVEVFNDRGHVVLRAIVNDALPSGLISIPKGWQRHQFVAGGYQEITARHLNPLTVNQSFFDTLVEVRTA
jgi:anaerobic selenocysteine-containing dehydrogenase